MSGAPGSIDRQQSMPGCSPGMNRPGRIACGLSSCSGDLSWDAEYFKVILGRYLNVSPEEVEFEYHPNGKPALSSRLLHPALCFNLSHSDELLLLAVTYHRAVGIDVETIHSDLEVENSRNNSFHQRRESSCRRCPRTGTRLLFCGWTRKEAYLKARGEGLTYPLDQFTVSMDCDQPAQLLEVKGDPQELSRWSFRMLTPAPGTIAALVVEGHHWHVAQWQLG